MFANSQRSPPRNTPNYPPGGSYAAESEAAPTVPSGPTQYADSELILTIYDRVSNPRGSWSGTASDLLEAANQEGRLIDVTTEQVAHDIEELEDLLFEYDRIQHFLLEDGSEGTVQHVFLLRE